MYLLFSSFFHGQMLRICLQDVVSSLVVHLYRCVAALSANVLSKVRKTTADNSDNARAADLQRRAAMIFREVEQGRAIGRIPHPVANYQAIALDAFPAALTPYQKIGII